MKIFFHHILILVLLTTVFEVYSHKLEHDKNQTECTHCVFVKSFQLVVDNLTRIELILKSQFLGRLDFISPKKLVTLSYVQFKYIRGPPQFS